MRLLSLSTLMLLLLMSCTGSELIDVDTTPPFKPHLIHHLGDAGDGMVENSNGEMIELTDENNGTDAVPTGDKIKIMWEYLEDTDLDYIKIYRFNYEQINFTTVDSILADGVSFYEDAFMQNSNPIGEEWFYCIEVFDQAGNSTISDTTSYELVDKPLLSYPADNQLIDDTQLYFRWNIVSGIEHYRLLLFDNNGILKRTGDIFESTTSGDSISFEQTVGDDLPPFFSGQWRIDAISASNSNMGSESNQRSIRIN
ncbi:MAG: hypothetical protein U9N34_05525 [Candidatus Cloacimonadota bacterium]|nr:hypothetical protein [Candidatus Cloacimonadota bacterium]